MKITFLGAAREVTGSCYLVQAAGVRFIVDCGMFQGGREAEAHNRRFPRFDPEALDFVLITHAHIDHSGLLPRLVTLGYRGPVYCSSATADLLAVLLPDAGHIHEKEAERANRDKRRRRGELKAEIAPLYTVIQAKESLKWLKAVGYDDTIEPHAGVKVRFRDAGHILGSSILEVWVQENGRERMLVFSGDLGMPGRPLMNDPAVIDEADWLLVESTYGNRLHKGMADTVDELAQAVNDTLHHKKGNVVIPAFAVGRTQDILYMLIHLVREGRIPGRPAIFVDSPMATAATEITFRHRAEINQESRQLMDWFQGNPDQAPHLHFTEDVEDSMALNQIREGAIIISASGMCDAGRVKHHLKYNLPREECTVVITGFQARRTLGRQLVDGARTVRIFREQIPVRADLYTLGGLSAHADRDALMQWLNGFRRPPTRTFVVHGEEDTALGFGQLVRDRLGWAVEVPEEGAGYEY